MTIRTTQAWQNAECEYMEIFGPSLPPPYGAKPPSQEEIMERMERIVKKCPKFYPALLALGFHKLDSEDHSLACKLIDKGFKLLLELVLPNHLEDEIVELQ